MHSFRIAATKWGFYFILSVIAKMIPELITFGTYVKKREKKERNRQKQGEGERERETRTKEKDSESTKWKTNKSYWIIIKNNMTRSYGKEMAHRNWNVFDAWLKGTPVNPRDCWCKRKIEGKKHRRKGAASKNIKASILNWGNSNMAAISEQERERKSERVCVCVRVYLCMCVCARVPMCKCTSVVLCVCVMYLLFKTRHTQGIIII